MEIRYTLNSKLHWNSVLKILDSIEQEMGTAPTISKSSLIPTTCITKKLLAMQRKIHLNLQVLLQVLAIEVVPLAKEFVSLAIELA